MTLRSKFPAVQDALAAAIEAAKGEGVAFSNGHPGKGGIKSIHIWLAADPRSKFPKYISGGRARDEQGSVLVKIIYTKRGTRYEDVRDGAYEVLGAVEDAIEADPTLGGLVDNCFVSAIEGREGFPDDKQRQYGIEATVSYTALNRG